MDAFDIYLDAAGSGRVMAHLLEPPGLGVRFESRARMRKRLPDRIAGHLAWLRRHGETVPPIPPDQYRMIEEVPVAGDFESGDDVGFYAPDVVPVSLDDIERYLRIAGYAHDDLLHLVQKLAAPQLDWVRNERTRSIRKIIRHVVGAELWYMTRIIDDPEAHQMPEILLDADRRIDATEDMVERLRIVWPAFQAWAQGLTPELRGTITVPTGFTERKDERWSARKMLRRCIEHCREHTRNIEQILAGYRAAVRS